MHVHTPSTVTARLRPSMPGTFGRSHQLLFFEEDRGNNPSGGTGGQGGQSNQSPSLLGILERHGNDPIRVIETLMGEGRDYRRRINELQGQVPAQGAVVLTTEQAQAWQAYQQLGTVEALTQERTTAQGAAGELATLKRQATLRSVQDASGASADVLGQLPGADRLSYEVRDVQVDGKPAKAVYVTEEGGTATELGAFVDAKYPAFKPAIFPAAGQQVQPSGTAFPRQQGGGQAPNQNQVSSYMKQAYGRKKAS
jgi:hypothetical protein